MRLLTKMTAERDRLQAELESDPRYRQLRELDAAIAVVSRYEPASKAAAAAVKMGRLAKAVNAASNNGKERLADTVLRVLTDANMPLFLDDVFKKVNAIRSTTRNSVGQVLHQMARKRLVRPAPGHLGLYGLPTMKDELKRMAADAKAAMHPSASASA